VTAQGGRRTRGPPCGAGVVTGGWPVAGNLARGREEEEKLGEEGADRWVPSVSDGGAVTGWQAGSCTEMDQSQRRAGPTTEKAAHDDFFNLNLFSN
jgi:hypothetical protein